MISVVVAQMVIDNHNGKLSWGACINTTGNRVCDPQGQFNREGADFKVVTYANVVKLESRQTHMGGYGTGARNLKKAE